MDKKAKYYKAMNFEYQVQIKYKDKPTPHAFWRSLDAITTVAIFDADINTPEEYMKLVHHKERLSQKYLDLYKHLPR